MYPLVIVNDNRKVYLRIIIMKNKTRLSRDTGCESDNNVLWFLSWEKGDVMKEIRYFSTKIVCCLSGVPQGWTIDPSFFVIYSKI